MTIEHVVLGQSMQAEVTFLQEGVHVLLTGGNRSHIGSVSLVRPGEQVRTLTFPDHREGMVSERWAAVLAERFCCPAAVACGIHYDNLTREGLDRVLKALDDMLEQII